MALVRSSTDGSEGVEGGPPGGRGGLGRAERPPSEFLLRLDRVLSCA